MDNMCRLNPNLTYLNVELIVTKASDETMINLTVWPAYVLKQGDLVLASVFFFPPYLLYLLDYAFTYIVQIAIPKL